MSADTVRVDPLQSATLEVVNRSQKDYFDLENALFGGRPPSPGKVSFKVEWTAQGSTVNVDNPTQRYRAAVRNAEAKMEWTARTEDFTFRSAPLATSITEGAQLGQESNGSYY